MKVSVARRNLFSDRTRLAISVGGVAVAILLILILLGVYKGLIDVSTSYVDNVDADLWVAQAGSRSMTHSLSLISPSLEDELMTVDGVSEIHPLVIRPTTVEINGKENDLRVAGYHPETGLGGPWNIVEGRGDPGPGEIVADRVLVDTSGLRLGDDIEIEGRPLRLVGVSRDTYVLIYSYAFADIGEIRDSLGPDRVNYFIIKAADSGRLHQIVAEITAGYPGLEIFTKAEFAEINARDIREGFLPILGVLVVIAVFVGMAIVGLVVYSATVERTREYGILKAVGASGRTLYGIVFQQSVLSGLMGYGTGALLAFAVAALLETLVPQLTISFSWTHFAGALAAALTMSLFASYIPIRKINGIDPVIVFKS
ncbi:MAG: ABC transporter permease [Thermoleophilia bacterium]|nr:ABC transporter permease [Thermoleophilia bacterium]